MEFQESQYLVDLPTPTVFKDVDFEKELAEIIKNFTERNPAYQEIILESDPLKKAFEAWAYDRVSRNNQYNEDLKQTMLKYATGVNLDVIAGNLLIYRRVIKPSDNTTVPPIPAVLETDESLRFRAQTASRLEQVAGPKSAYERLSIEADENVKEAFVLLPTPVPGEVHVYLRSIHGDGKADKALINIVNKFLSAEERRPLNDIVRVKSGEIIYVDISLIASYYVGYLDEDVNKNVQKTVMDLNKILSFGDPLTHNLIHATARVPGIKNLKILKPLDDITPARYAYVVIKSVTIKREVEES